MGNCCEKYKKSHPEYNFCPICKSTLKMGIIIPKVRISETTTAGPGLVKDGSCRKIKIIPNNDYN